jgi:hypothetical protein
VGQREPPHDILPRPLRRIVLHHGIEQQAALRRRCVRQAQVVTRTERHRDLPEGVESLAGVVRQHPGPGEAGIERVARRGCVDGIDVHARRGVEHREERRPADQRATDRGHRPIQAVIATVP